MQLIVSKALGQGTSEQHKHNWDQKESINF